MHLTRRVSNTHFLAAIAFFASLGALIAAQPGEKVTLLLDLTKPVSREQQGVGAPGASGGGVGGQPLPRGYPLPFTLQLLSISPQPAKPGDKLIGEVLLQNTGDSAFSLPASQNRVKVLKQGNKGRRTFLYFLVFEDPKSGQQNSYVMGSANGSDTIPTSWLRVKPGQSVRVLFKGDTYAMLDWLKPELQIVRVRAQISEWKYEDKRYFIETTAEPVLSSNELTLELAPPK